MSIYIEERTAETSLTADSYRTIAAAWQLANDQGAGYIYEPKYEVYATADCDESLEDWDQGGDPDELQSRIDEHYESLCATRGIEATRPLPLSVRPVDEVLHAAHRSDELTIYRTADGRIIAVA